MGNRINEEALNHKIESLKSLADGNGEVRQLSDILKKMDDWQLLRMNPFRLANEHSLNPSHLIDLFVWGAKVGLFDFVWSLICTHCANIAVDCETLSQTNQETFYCPICHFDVPTGLDDEVETSFSINAGVKKILVNPFQDLKAYRRFHFTGSFQFPEEYARYLDEITRGFAAIEPDQTVELEFEAEEGKMYRLLSLDRHAVVTINVSSQAPAANARREIGFLENRFSVRALQVPPGPVCFRIQNLGLLKAAVLILYTDFDELYRVMMTYPVRRLPYLSGKMLLNNQIFRETFRFRNLSPNLKLNVRSLTILFTDLKGSTALYEREGDGIAYELIQTHFKILRDAVRANSGAIVKTIGDSIMASFSTAADGVAAACDMVSRIRELNQTAIKAHLQLGLKVGVHTGPTLAVNANDRLDYFGQTVNIAARVQSLADAGQIRFTVPVRDAIGESFRGLAQEEEMVRLKGLVEHTLTYRIQP